MSETDSAAAPESGTTIPTFEELAADPQIAPLLDFAPVPRTRAFLAYSKARND